MCGIVGFINFQKEILDNKEILFRMNSTLKKRGPDEDGYYIENPAYLGHKRLIVIDPEGGKTTNGRNLLWWTVCTCL